MAISKIKLPDNSVQELRDSRMGNAKIFYGTCNTAAATVAKVVTCADFTSSDLVKGALIFVKFDYTNSGAVANLTLDVNGTGAKPLKKQYNVTGSNNLVGAGELVADSTYLFQYNGTNWICMTLDYNSTYTLFNLPVGGGNYKTSSVLYRYELLFQQDDDTFTPLNNVNNGYDSVSKTILTNVEFDPFGIIYYYGSTSGVSANGYISAGSLYYHYGADLRYTFNISTTVNALTTNKNVYLKVSPQSNGKVKLASATPLVQDLPTTNDGYYYIFLGRAYSTYQIILYTEHPVYYHNGTEVVELLNPKQKAGIEDLMSEVDTVTGDSLTANNIILGNGSSAIKSSGKTIATTLGTDDTTVPTSKAVKDAIDALPEPMIFKGTLGTGGTITSLPAAAAGNTGYTYKVITNGTYQSIAAKDGDTFISNGSSWTLIPSGDEPSGTVTSVTLNATSPIAINSSAAITTSGTRTISHANSGVTAGTYKSVTVDAKGHVTGGTNPTTLSGYGITDAKIANGVITLGSNTITPLTAESSLKEAFLTWGGKNFTASYGPIDAVMIPELGANRLAFLNPSTTAIEYSKNGGSTWIDYGATDTEKIALVSGLSGSFVIGKSTTSQVATANDKLRITIEANGLYTTLNKFAIYLSTSGSTGCTCTVMSRTRANYDSNTDTWITNAENVSVSGWSGWNIINIPLGITFGNNASQYRQIRFIFSATGHSGGSYAGLTVIKLLGFGGQGWATPSTMAANGHLYSYDANKNATFPAKVTATSFVKSGGTSSQFLKADGSVDSNTYITSASLPSAMSASEANTGTATTARTITAAVLAGAINNKITCMTQNEVDATVNTIFS